MPVLRAPKQTSGMAVEWMSVRAVCCMIQLRSCTAVAVSKAAKNSLEPQVDHQAQWPIRTKVMPGKLSTVQRRRSKRQRSSLCRIQGRHGPAARGIWLLLSLAAAGSQAAQAAPLGFESGLAASAVEEREVEEVIGGPFADLLADTPASGARQLQQSDVSGAEVSTLPQGVQYAINALSRGSTAAEKLKAFPRCGQAHIQCIPTAVGPLSACLVASMCTNV